MFRTLVTLFLFGLVSSPALQAAEADAEPKWQSMLTNQELTGWVVEGAREFKEGDAKQPVWTVKDDKIICAGKGYGFLRYDAQQFGDFEFQVEYKMKSRANSGLGIRGTKFSGSSKTRPSYHSYEIQLLDDAGKEPSKHSSYSLYRYMAASSNPGKPAGEWNTILIRCVGPQITILVNGEQIQDFDQTTLRQTKNKPLCGYLSLQNHGGYVEFRDPKVRELAPCSQ